MSYFLQSDFVIKYLISTDRLIIIIKSKCLITEEQLETLVQSESQEESHQVMLTHTELSIAVGYQFSNTDIFLYRYGPSRPRSPIDP